MKRLLSLLIVSAFLVSATSSFAASPLPKIKDGMVGILSSPLGTCEIVRTETKSAKFLPFGFVGGVLKGGFEFGKKIVKGAWDVVTSPVELTKS